MKTKHKLEICKMITISTGHISLETAEFIDREDIASFKSEYGWVIYTTPYDAEDYPKDLTKLLIFSKEKGCDFLKLDRDGSFIPEFKKYAW